MIERIVVESVVQRDWIVDWVVWDYLKMVVESVVQKGWKKAVESVVQKDWVVDWAVHSQLADF